MKIGTRFKVEFEKVTFDRCRAIGAPHAGRAVSPDYAGCSDFFYGATLLDVIEPPPPRVRWTDPKGKVYEILREGEYIQVNDLIWSESPYDTRIRPISLSIGTVVVGGEYILRPVKE
jgi:hypothetical protein